MAVPAPGTDAVEPILEERFLLLDLYPGTVMLESSSVVQTLSGKSGNMMTEKYVRING